MSWKNLVLIGNLDPYWCCVGNHENGGKAGLGVELPMR
jgi:hypothetical protein